MLRLKLILLVLIIGGASCMADDPVLQLVNLSADSTMDIVQVEYGDSVLVDSLKFNEATGYLTVPAAAGVSLTYTSLSDTLISFELSTLNLAAGEVFQSILYGVLDTNNYYLNPEGNNRELNATWNQVDTSGISSGDVRVNFFHAVSDAVEMDVADLDYEFIVNNMSYGEYSSNSTDLPSTLRKIFFLSTDSVTQIASRSADLSTITGNTATIFLSGFIIPINNSNGPAIKFSMVDAAGNVTELGLILAVNQDELFGEINVYPNPASDIVNIDLQASNSVSIQLSLVDLSGRQLIRSEHNLSSGLNNLRMDLPDLPHGYYLIRLSNDNGQSVLPIIIR